MENKEIKLSQFFLKLGHDLEEIRVRALNSILLKLEHGVICDADLVQERQLLIKLLEWFNFVTCPHQESVLQLLLRLSKHTSAAGILLNVGGVEFLTQLRHNVQPHLYKLIDQTLDTLFHLPVNQQLKHHRECIYKDNISKVSVENVEEVRTFEDDSVSRMVECKGDISSNQSQKQSPQQKSFNSYVGYFNSKVPNEVSFNSFNNNQASSCDSFKLATFPWVSLTPTDRHVLFSTNNSLRSNDMSLVVSACEFLRDVVFQDFPAEVFLQRPEIIKGLFLLLTISIDSEPSIVQNSLITLQQLLTFIKAQIFRFQDPSFFSTNQDLTIPRLNSSSGSSFLSRSMSSSDTRPSLVGDSNLRHQGDGCDTNISTPLSSSGGQPSVIADNMDNLPDETATDLQSLLFSQWTVPQLCTQIFTAVSPLLKTNNETVISTIIDLLRESIALTLESVTPSDLWTDTSVPARDMVENLQDFLEKFVECLLHHRVDESCSLSEKEIRLQSIIFVSLCSFFSEIISELIPLKQARLALSNSVVNMVSYVCSLHNLSFSYPEIKERLFPFLIECDSEEVSLHQHVEKLSYSINFACDFLMRVQDQSDKNLVNLITLADEALLALPYFESPSFIENSILVISQICGKTTPNPLGEKLARNVCNRLLSSSIENIRSSTYNKILSLVKDSLSVSKTVEPTSVAFQSVVFLFHKSVLYEISCYGLTDENKEIRGMATDILLHLTQSQLLMSTKRWQQFLDAFITVLPVLQGHILPENNFGKSLLNIIHVPSSNTLGSLSNFEKMRATLRLLYNNNIKIREEALTRLAWFLGKEQGSHLKIPVFSSLDMSRLVDIFIVDEPLSLQLSTHTTFEFEILDKILDIVKDEKSDVGVRKSAMEQLATILKDANLHAKFLSSDGLEFCIKIIEDSVRKLSEKDQDNKNIKDNLILVPSVVTILLSILCSESTVRHKLSHEERVYYALFRCGLLLHTFDSTRKEISVIFSLFLFDEFLSLSIDDKSEVMKSIENFNHLPFKSKPLVSSDHYEIPAYFDKISEGIFFNKLKLCWNIGWFAGVDNLVKRCKSKEEMSSELFNVKLQMNFVDCIQLFTFHLPSALLQCISDISNAISHDLVSLALHRLTLFVVSKKSFQIETHVDNWVEVLNRFFLIIPSSTADEKLLNDILSFLLIVLKHNPHKKTKEWVLTRAKNPKGALLGMLQKIENVESESTSESVLFTHRQLNRILLQFFQTFVGGFPYTLRNCLSQNLAKIVDGNMSNLILHRLNCTGSVSSSHFYNLPSLQNTLLCLLHLTARPGWSLASSEKNSCSLNILMLQSLLEVVTAFHVGRGGMAMSFMGRGVISCATTCLLQLAYEMTTQLKSQDWPRNWLFSKQATENFAGESGFHWLLPLWTYRDAEVRAAGIGIAVALTSTEAGRITMTTQCQHISGGIWGAAFSVLLDPNECSIVRQKAAALLTNLTSQPLPSVGVTSKSTSSNKQNNNTSSAWQLGPLVHNSQSQETLVGVDALFALLEHSDFFREMLHLVDSYFPQPVIYPLLLRSNSSPSTPVSSQITLTTLAPNSAQNTNTDLTDIESSNQFSSSTLPIPKSQASEHKNNLTSTSSTNSSGSTTPTNSWIHNNENLHNSNTSQPVLGAKSGNAKSSHEDCLDYSSVATPSLISYFCRFVTNLILLKTDYTIESLNQLGLLKVLSCLLNSNLLAAYVKEISLTKYRRLYLLTFCDLLNLHADILSLFAICVHRSSILCLQLLAESCVLQETMSLLAITFEDGDVQTLCEQLWLKSLELITSLFQKGKQEAVVGIIPLLGKYWDIVIGRVISILHQTELRFSVLWTTAVNFLAIVFSEDLCYHQTDNQKVTYKSLSQIFERKSANAHSEKTIDAVILSKSLISIFEDVYKLPMDQNSNCKVPAYSALKFALSIDAIKSCCLEMGLIDSLCHHLRNLQINLSLEALDLNRPPLNNNTTKKNSSVLEETIWICDIIHNFIVGNLECKIAAYDCSLAQVIHQMWAWCQINPSLMLSVLSLLSAFIANCPKASSSLSHTSSSLPLSETKTDARVNQKSLVHCIIRLIHKESSVSGNVKILRPAFSLLTALSLSSETISILHKNNFLNGFNTYSLSNKSKSNKHTRQLQLLWMDLMLNLSFSINGQNLMMKIPGVVNVLLEFAETDQKPLNQHAIISIRNLCLQTPNKLKLLTNDRFIPMLITVLEKKSDEEKLIACSTLWTLIYSSQKAKVCLKDFHILRKLQEIYGQFMINTEETDTRNKCTKHLCRVIEELKT